MPPKTTRTNITKPTGMTQTRTTNPNPTSLTQARTTSLNPISLTQTRPPILNSTSLTQTITTIPNPTGPERTCLNMSSSPSGGVRKSSRWASFLSSDSQGQAGEGPSGSGRMVVYNDVITQPPVHARPRSLRPVSSLFESGDEFSFDDFLSEDL